MKAKKEKTSSSSRKIIAIISSVTVCCAAITAALLLKPKTDPDIDSQIEALRTQYDDLLAKMSGVESSRESISTLLNGLEDAFPNNDDIYNSTVMINVVGDDMDSINATLLAIENRLDGLSTGDTGEFIDSVHIANATEGMIAKVKTMNYDADGQMAAIAKQQRIIEDIQLKLAVINSLISEMELNATSGDTEAVTSNLTELKVLLDDLSSIDLDDLDDDTRAIITKITDNLSIYKHIKTSDVMNHLNGNGYLSDSKDDNSYSTLTSDLSSTIHDLSNTQQSLDEQLAEIMKLQSKIELIAADLRSQKAEYASGLTTIETISANMNGVLSEIESLGVSNALLQADIDAIEQSMNTLSGEVESLSLEVLNNKQQIDVLNTSLQQYSAQMTSCLNVIADIQNKLIELSETDEELRAAIESIDQKYLENAGQINQFREQLLSANQNISGVSATVEQHSSDLQSQAQTIIDIQNRLAQEETNSSQVTTDIADIEDRVNNNLDPKIGNIENYLSSFTIEYDESTGTLYIYSPDASGHYNSDVSY